MIEQGSVIDVRRLTDTEFRAIVLTQLATIYRLLQEFNNAASNGHRPKHSSDADAHADGAGSPLDELPASPSEESRDELAETYAGPALILPPGSAC